MNISYITTYNPLDIHNWSGLGYSIAKCLENQGNDLSYIGNLEYELNLYLKYKYKLYRKLKLNFDITREKSIAKQYAQQALQRISLNCDLIFSPGTIPIAYLESNKPKVFYTDATFAGMINYYDEFSNLSKETIYIGNKLEQKALDNCDLAIYSSEWAAETALENYKVDARKVKVVPFGANLQWKFNSKEIRDLVLSKQLSTCHLLFIGVEWERKGGNKAIEITRILNSMGLKTTLHLVGINDIPVNELPDFVINHGFISKSNPEGVNLLKELFEKSHFLVVPTIAEAYGLVFCEANAYALPAISINTGGISTIIKNNINGVTFSLNSDVNEWCDYIFNLFQNHNLYRELCISSYNEYTTRLNWDVAGKSLMKLIESIK
jgi:glycosyltransferase involved in cell wall biosynthesis